MSHILHELIFVCFFLYSLYCNRGALSVRRTSDLAEQALHGIALDLSLKNVLLIQCANYFYAKVCFSAPLRQRLSRFVRYVVMIM